MRTELKVGLLILISFAGMLFMLTRITQGGLTTQNGMTYFATVEDATGLTSRSSVKVAGIGVGSISKIELQGREARLTLKVNPKKVVIHENATVELKRVGYLGDKYLALDPGTPSSQPLRQRSEIPLAEQPVDLEDLTDEGARLAQNLNDLLGSLLNSLSAPAERSRGQQQNLERKKRPPDREPQNQKTDQDRAETPQTRLDAIIENLARISEELADLKGLDQLVAQMKGVSKNLAFITERIRNGEGTVGRLVMDETIADRIETTLASADRAIEGVRGTEISAALSGAYLTDESRSRSGFALEILTPSRQRLLVGGTYRPDLLVGLGSDQNDLSLDLQYTYSFGDFALRGGLFEGTAGAGAEIQFGKRSMGYAEIYRFGEDQVPAQLNSGIRLEVAGPLRVWAGGDYLTSENNRSFFMGLELRWRIFNISSAESP